MSFRLVSKSVTSNDLERRSSRNLCVISANWVAFGTDYVNVLEDTLILSAAEMYESSFQRYIIYGDNGRGSLPARAL